MGSSDSRQRSVHWCVTLLLFLSMIAAALPLPTAAQSDLRYFYETGHYLRGAFRQHWERNGGLPIFGFPITEEYYRSDGRIVQWFERARFELASTSPLVVELGRLGFEATGDRIFPQVPPFTTNRDRRYFAETGHSLKGLFRRTWETRGAERIFGFPISEEINEQINGQWTLVQYFERTRFELRLQPSRVEFGQLGRSLAPVQLLDPWPPEVAPQGPLNEDGTPKPPAGYVPGRGRANIRLIYDGHKDGDYRIEGEGFRAGERVRFLLESPEGKVSTINGQPLADVNGSISYAGVRVDSDDLKNGRWFVTAQGQTSGRVAIAVLQIGGGGGGGGQPAPGLSVRLSPGSGTIGQSFLVQGDGFQPGEKVSLWLTAPDSSVRGIDTVPEADGNGSITGAGIRITADNSFRVGVWSLTAQGRQSGRQSVGQFRIDAGGGGGGGGGQPAPVPPGGPGNPNRLGQLIHDGLRVRGDGSIVPLAAPPEIPFTFNARGFATNERVGVWLTRPDGGVDAIDARNVRNDGRGGISVTFKASRQQEGNWTITAQGASTNRAVTAPFRITREFVAPPGTGRPANRNGTVSPSEGSQRTGFRITATGFRANEPLEFWITSPDGIYYLAPSVTADSRGRLGISPALVVQFGPQNPAGVYGYHYRGTRSGVRADIYFTFNGAP